jgi:phosphoribosylaminoimidazole carboxylase PurE protein
MAAAGMAAHLGGVVAAEAILPIIGIPIDASPLGGLDSLLSIVQMPPGIPVATMAIGKAGARNGAILAVQILALGDAALTQKLLDHKKAMAQEVVVERNKKLQDYLAKRKS